MAVGLSAANAANKFLEWLFNATSTGTAPANIWIQLHTGDPGASGTANVAGNATRKDLTAAMGTASGGAITNTAAITWTTGEVDTSEDYTHWALFDASTSGTFLCSGTMTANAVTVGDEFTIPIGDFDASFNTAA
ncbi:hypothetical protein [Kribbella sp. NPDC050470]|uniref:phage tail fiber protein n=1 Tax=unclassified Kribbella TaxID=2644121 RepID=UPI0037B4AEE2